MASSMNIESGTMSDDHHDKGSKSNKKKPINWPLLLLNAAFMAIGVIGGPLLSRLYYLHGGGRKWVNTFTQSAGFPILFAPLFFLYLRHRSNPQSTHFFMESKLFVASAIIGVFVGLDNFLYTLGLSYLPVSTSSILYATQLAFIAVFARIIVRQKFTPFTINSVVLMTLGSVLLGLRTSGDRPAGVTGKGYLFGFFLTLGSAGLIGLVWPCVELCYAKATRVLNFTVVLQFQLNVAAFASIVSFIAMIANKDFQAMQRESRERSWGVIFCVGSLLNGILSAVLLPMTEIAAVFAYHEKFTGEKGMALALCLWGFTSYFYGEYQTNKKAKALTKEQADDQYS
ncbi:hypothetical protein Scep_002663 [Stephania cephalantha]|uniref:Probable purine permease n=1 Tax=Stephania cephalantha TaxID=152367 RepID=A0AAP0LAA9_9MAGN